MSALLLGLVAKNNQPLPPCFTWLKYPLSENEYLPSISCKYANGLVLVVSTDKIEFAVTLFSDSKYLEAVVPLSFCLSIFQAIHQ